MKINTLQLASFFCIYGTFASVIIGAMGTALAESNPPMPNQSLLNGLYSPTASERFFEEGKRKIERETKILVNPERYKREGILKNNIVNNRIEQLEEANPIINFPNDGLQ
ncbi:hypothetical protein [Calothrix sp. CCY 0018]|uniref:hypothetical protein n=1 Tax=Calothrix sp. CCY 0018 TaxID=3103864 RepID=UPI0039C74DE2